jgi:hypothetical protein
MLGKVRKKAARGVGRPSWSGEAAAVTDPGLSILAVGAIRPFPRGGSAFRPRAPARAHPPPASPVSGGL